MIQASKTFTSDDEMCLCIDELIVMCPQIKLQEIRMVFDNIIAGRYREQGKFYERFKIAEVLDGFRQYEANERCEILEKRNHIHAEFNHIEIKSTVESLENYVHEMNYGKNDLKSKMSIIGKDGKEIVPTISELKKGLLTDEELEIIKNQNK